jgi:15-cis-phytoene synthase
MKNANAYCKNKAAQSGSSFYYSFLFLPPEQRSAITAIYAFCREVDDVVDECSDKNIASQKLLWWSTEIERAFYGNPQHPVGIALATAIPKYKLQKQWFDEIIQGMAMDLQYQGYQSFEDLKVYCHCVASAVGMLAATVFGYKNSKTLDYAKKLGIAFQIINIIRDIGEDARRGRLYIPEEELSAFGITPTEILNLKIEHPDRFQALMGKQAALARSYYTAALESLMPEDRATQRSGIIMARIYFDILDTIERANFDVLHQKISITPLRKLWLAWSTWRSEKKQYA